MRPIRPGAMAGRGAGSVAARGAVALLLLLGGGGCESGIVDRHGGHPEVAGVRLLDGAGVPLDSTGSLDAAWPTVLEVRFLDRGGNEIAGLELGHRSELRWSRVGAVVSEAIPGSPFRHLLRVVEPCGPPLEVEVGYGHGAFADERVFGPFPLQPRSAVRSARILDAEGVELTDSVVLPVGVPVRLEVRFDDCAGEPVTDPGDHDRMRLHWAPVGAVEEEVVEGERFARIVRAVAPARTEGQMSVGLGRAPEADAQVFGPFRLLIVPVADQEP